MDTNESKAKKDFAGGLFQWRNSVPSLYDFGRYNEWSVMNWKGFGRKESLSDHHAYLERNSRLS
jgi:hypothetical protein